MTLPKMKALAYTAWFAVTAYFIARVANSYPDKLLAMVVVAGAALIVLRLIFGIVEE